MKKWVKILLGIVVALVVLIAGFTTYFLYKVQYGIATYETDPHDVKIPQEKLSILLFSKTTGFRHSESIAQSKITFQELADSQGWFLYETEDAGIINEQQLKQFEVIVWNNSTGRCLTDEQRGILESYVQDGGTLLGIHGTGDFSHPDWNWHLERFIGASFSHHPIENQLQTATITMESGADSTLTAKLPPAWDHTEEWYIFYDNPRDHGYDILLSIDGNRIDPNGNLLWIRDKNFGMGADHPVAWSKDEGAGKVFYTSLGHTAEVWTKPEFVQLLTNIISWGVLSNNTGD